VWRSACRVIVLLLSFPLVGVAALAIGLALPPLAVLGVALCVGAVGSGLVSFGVFAWGGIQNFFLWIRGKLWNYFVRFSRWIGIPFCSTCEKKGRDVIFCKEHFCRVHQFFHGSAACPGCKSENELCRHKVRSWGSLHRVYRVRTSCTLCFCTKHKRDAGKVQGHVWRVGKCKVCLDPCPLHPKLAKDECAFCWCGPLTRIPSQSGECNRARTCKICKEEGNGDVEFCKVHPDGPRECVCEDPCPNNCPDVRREDCINCYCSLHKRSKEFLNGNTKQRQCVQCTSPCRLCYDRKLGNDDAFELPADESDRLRTCCFKEGLCGSRLRGSHREFKIRDIQEDGERVFRDVPALEECEEHFCGQSGAGHMRPKPCPVCDDPCPFEHEDVAPSEEQPRVECKNHWCRIHERPCPFGTGKCDVCNYGCRHPSHKIERDRPTRMECSKHWCFGNCVDDSDPPIHQPFELSRDGFCPIKDDPCGECDRPHVLRKNECDQHWCRDHNRPKVCVTGSEYMCEACENQCLQCLSARRPPHPIPRDIECEHHYCRVHSREAAPGRSDGRCIICIDPCPHHPQRHRRACCTCFCIRHDRQLCESEDGPCQNGRCPECRCTNCSADLRNPDGASYVRDGLCTICQEWCECRIPLRECGIHFCREHGMERDDAGRCRVCETCAHGVEPKERCPRCYCRLHEREISEDEVVCTECFVPRVPLTKTRFCKLVARFINWQFTLGLLPIHFEIGIQCENEPEGVSGNVAQMPRDSARRIRNPRPGRIRLGNEDRLDPLLFWRDVWRCVSFRIRRPEQDNLDRALDGMRRNHNGAYNLFAMWGVELYILWHRRVRTRGVLERNPPFDVPRSVHDLSHADVQIWVATGFSTVIEDPNVGAVPAGVPLPQTLINSIAPEELRKWRRITVSHREDVRDSLLPRHIYVRRRAPPEGREHWGVQEEFEETLTDDRVFPGGDRVRNDDRLDVLKEWDFEEFREITNYFGEESFPEFDPDSDIPLENELSLLLAAPAMARIAAGMSARNENHLRRNIPIWLLQRDPDPDESTP